jgi:nitroreductase
MLPSRPQFQYQACHDCGAPVPNDAPEEHRCEHGRFVEYQMLVLRAEILAFEAELQGWLDTAEGRFASYYASRQRAA